MVALFRYIDLILVPPLTVEIEAREALRAGHREQIVCRAKGARPPSVITWLLQGTPLPSHTYRQEVICSNLFI